MPPRIARTPLVLATLLVLATALALVEAVSTSATERMPATAQLRPVVVALAVLHHWDGRRSAAYAAGDPGQLRRLYSRGSWAGARDVRLLREYADRGLVVDDLQSQVLDAELVSRSPEVLRLRVVERLASGTVRSRHSETVLPADRARERELTFVHLQRGWVLREVS